MIGRAPQLAMESGEIVIHRHGRVAQALVRDDKRQRKAKLRHVAREFGQQ